MNYANSKMVLEMLHEVAYRERVSIPVAKAKVCAVAEYSDSTLRNLLSGKQVSKSTMEKTLRALEKFNLMHLSEGMFQLKAS